MSACSPEGQPYPDFHEKKRDQQVKEGNLAPLLCFRETPPGVLRTVLGPQTQEGHGVVGEGPEEGREGRLREFELFSMEKGQGQS